MLRDMQIVYDRMRMSYAVVCETTYGTVPHYHLAMILSGEFVTVEDYGEGRKNLYISAPSNRTSYLWGFAPVDKPPFGVRVMAVHRFQQYHHERILQTVMPAIRAIVEVNHEK